VLPRPESEYPLVDFQAITGGSRQASDYAMKGDDPGKGDGRGGESTGKHDPNSQASGNTGDKDKGPGSGEGNNAAGQQGDKSGGQQKGQGNNGQQQGQGDKGQQQGENSKGGQKNEGGRQGQSGKQESSGSGSRNSQGSQRSGRSQNANAGSRSQASSPPALGGAAAALKWVVFAIIGLVTVGIVLFAIVRFLANFTPWAARFLKGWSDFWARLFGRRGKETESDEPAVLQARARPPRPFSSFHNPFRLGQPWTPFELCCYTFSAFEAWAREHGVARQPGETPLEHAERLGEEIPDMETDARRLALIYARGLYAADELPPAVTDVLQQVWERLEAGGRQPVGV
jgi:hypothetical protein